MIKTIIAVALILALGGATVHFYMQSSSKDVQLAALQQNSRELEDLRAEHVELVKLRTQAEQTQVATQSVSELAKLRGQVSSLTEQTKKLNQQNQQLVQQKEQLNSQLQQQAQGAAVQQQNMAQQQNVVEALEYRNFCINNLRLIDSAKQQWALENKKTAADTPAWLDLQPYLGRGPQGAIPTCPMGGTYNVGRVQDAPTCSIAGHHL